MICKTSRKKFEFEEELLKFLQEASFSSHDEVGIVAGHFMLMYDDLSDCLTPMIYQETKNPRVTHLSQEMAGEFPLKTFRMGVNLVKYFEANVIKAKLALIVNDHIFQTEGWSLQNLPDDSRAGELRRSFYRQKFPIPMSYFWELKAAGLTPDSIVDTDNQSRTTRDILPKHSRLFSEQALRNFFDENTRLKFRQLPTFKEVRNEGGKSKLLFVGSENEFNLCLTEGAECGCSGELIEFFVRLAGKGFNKLVFFVPEECKVAADAGVKVFMHSPQAYRKNLTHIYTIHGFGGMAENGIKKSKLEVIEYRLI